MNKTFSLRALILYVCIIYFTILPIISNVVIFALGISLLFILINSNYLRHVDIRILIIIVCLVASLVICYLYGPSIAYMNSGFSSISVSVLSQNIRYFCYLVITLLLFETMTDMKVESYQKFETLLEKVIVLYLLLFWLFFIMRNYIPDVFYSIRNIYFGTDVNLNSYSAIKASGYLDRYSFVFLDPNNCGYCTLLVSGYVFSNCKRIVVRIISIISLIGTPIITGSRGVLLALMASICILLFITNHGSRKSKFGIVAFLCVTLALFVEVLTGNGFIDAFLDSNNVLANRISNGNDGRIVIWKNVIESFGIPPLIGSGYTLVDNGKYITTHSDILRLLYGFGIIIFCTVAAYLMKIIKKIRIKWYYIPVIIAAMINSVIDEPRFLYITFIIMASDYVIEERIIKNE